MRGMIHDLWKKFLGVLVFGIVVTVVVLLIGNVSQMEVAVVAANGGDLALAALFSLLIYSGRFLKWQIFLHVLHVDVPRPMSLRIFLCGISMGITPGKLGEVLKSYLLKLEAGVDFSRTAPTVVAERLTGVVGCFLLCCSAFVISKGTAWYQVLAAAAAVSCVLSGILLFRSSLFAGWFRRGVAYLPFLRRKQEAIAEMYDSLAEILSPGGFLLCVFISICYWSMECMVFVFVLRAFSVQLPLTEAVLSLTALSLGSGITFLPGSIGALEGGMIGFFAYQGISVATAGCIALLHRFLLCGSMLGLAHCCCFALIVGFCKSQWC